MSNNAKRLLKQGLLALSVTALLSGCMGDKIGQSDSASALAGTQMVEVTGGAVKGVIQQGIVTAHRLVLNENGVYVSDEAISEPVRTDANGGFKLELAGEAEGWALVELVADEQTTMKCDVVPQCEVAGKAPVAFGESFTLDHQFTLRGAVDLSKGEAYLTPLSHMAVALAERRSNGLAGAALTRAYGEVEALFGLVPGSLSVAPPDLTALDQGIEPSDNALQLAVVNAAFLGAVNGNDEWDGIADVLDEMINQVSATGGLEIIGAADQLSLASLVVTSAEQAEMLQNLYPSLPGLGEKLARVQDHNSSYFSAIEDAYISSADGEFQFDQKLTDTNAVRREGLSGGAVQPGSGDSAVADNETGADLGGNTDVVVEPNAALLSWTPPMDRENGENLYPGEIAGYEVRYGTSPEQLDHIAKVEDGTAQSQKISGLTQGTWYFQIRTIDEANNYSRWSPAVQKTVNI